MMPSLSQKILHYAKSLTPKNGVPAAYTEKLATFLKEDDWGARDLLRTNWPILGGSDENTDDLNRFFLALDSFKSR
jgi:hypothetical protein